MYQFPSMLRSLLFFCVFAALSFLTGFAQGDEVPSGGHTLVIYLSRTENTRVLAQIIHAQVGGRLVRLRLEDPYPEDYRTTVDQVSRENETGYLPPLTTRVDIQRYDTLYVGFPTWGMQLPPPVKSFLRQYDLRGKVVVPFNTNAGYGVGSSFDTVRELCPQSRVLNGYTTRGGIERDGVYPTITGERRGQVAREVAEWLTELREL